MKKIIYLFLLFFASHIYAQDVDSFYTIESYQDVYIPLEDYNSMVIETQASLSWSKRFELNFNFPFIDTSYNYINCKWNAVCWFDNSTDFSIFLLSYGYDYDIPDNFNNIQSDVRYTQKERNGQKALVLEFLKNRLITDTTVEEHDSYITFQQWFLEDGDMEIHFGDMNLEHSSVYVPGEGFYFMPGNSEPLLFGPGIGLIHPNDDENKMGFLGTYDTFDIIDGIGVLRKLPPKGWVIKFNREDATPTSQPGPGAGTTRSGGTGRAVVHGLLALVVLGAGLAGGWYFLLNQETVGQRAPPERSARLVQTTPARVAAEVVSASGDG